MNSRVALPVVFAVLAVAVAGCDGPRSHPGVGAVESPDGCTVRVSDVDGLRRALAAAGPGVRVCVNGDLPARVEVDRPGAPGRPVEVLGDGRATVTGITVMADHVVVSGLRVAGGKAPGIEITGTDITVENNAVDHPVGGDYDGLRFFGTDLTIRHNTIDNIGPDGSDAHADCMQTFATGSDSPASQHVLIEGNRCQRIANQCLIAEGPNSAAGDGSGQGTTADLRFVDNLCDAHASQAVYLDDVRDAVIAHNEVQCGVLKAFAIANHSTGLTVADNDVDRCTDYQVGLDDTSTPGYHGPPSGGQP